VARRASDGGARVIATTRSGKWRAEGPPRAGVELRPFDIVEDGDDALRALLTDANVALFCWTPSGDQDRRRLYVDGAEKIARVCRDSSLRRVVYTSSTSALGAHDGPVDEDFPGWPDTPRGRVQREAEERLARGFIGSPVAWTILRLAGLYGPGRELARIYRVADEDRVRPGDGLERTNLVHLDDVTAAVLAATRLPTSDRGVIHVCDDDHRTRREVASAVAQATGHREPRWEEPADGRAPRGKLVTNTKMKERLGIRLQHPRHHT